MGDRAPAEVPAYLLDERSCLIEQLISIAFDVLGAHHLEVRVHPAERWHCALRDGRVVGSV